jgi:hypothetical protein
VAAVVIDKNSNKGSETNGLRSNINNNSTSKLNGNGHANSNGHANGNGYRRLHIEDVEDDEGEFIQVKKPQRSKKVQQPLPPQQQQQQQNQSNNNNKKFPKQNGFNNSSNNQFVNTISIK